MANPNAVPPRGRGRPKGSRNKSTLKVADVARKLVDRPGYRKVIQARLDEGSLPPAVETMLWHYAYGKPKELLEHSGPDGTAPVVIHNHILPPRDESGDL